MKWTVEYSNQVSKACKKLPRDIFEIFYLFVQEIILDGPYRTNWKNYSILTGKKNIYHCHIKSGKPTYVICWEIKDKKIKIIEVYYVGTHENSPY